MAMLKETLSVINPQEVVTTLKNKHQLNTLIVDSKGRPDTLAINLYWDEFRSWHNLKKEYKKGNVVYLQKLHKRGIQLCYRGLSEKYNFSEETIRRKIVKLEKLGLLSRDFEISQNYSKVLYNQLVIYIWRQTPHFYNPLGVDREEVKELKPSTNHKYISSKYGTSSTPHNEDTYTTNKLIGIHTHEDTYLLSTELREREEEALAYSSSLSKKEKINKKKKAKIQSAEIVQITNTEPEPTPQEAITEIPTLATSSLAELAKVYQTEEIRSEASEVVNYDQLKTQLYEKSVQLETQALAAEKEHYQSHKNRESSSGISLLQDVPLLTNLLIEPNTETTEIQEEITQMKAQQIPLEPERNMEFELSGAIFKNFGSARSNEIMENCKFIPITPSKLGVQVSNGFSLSANDKDTLKACIRQVYGDNISIVSSAVVKIAQPETKFLQEAQNEPKIQKWEKLKKELLSFFPEKTGDHILNAWFDKLRVSEDVSNNRIILTGSTFYIDSVYHRFQSAIESVVKKQKVTLELHYENNSQRPIIYKPNGGF